MSGKKAGSAVDIALSEQELGNEDPGRQAALPMLLPAASGAGDDGGVFDSQQHREVVGGAYDVRRSSLRC